MFGLVVGLVRITLALARMALSIFWLFIRVIWAGFLWLVKGVLEVIRFIAGKFRGEKKVISYELVSD